MKRTGITRFTPLARGTSKLGRRTEPRRAVHPFPLPTPGEALSSDDVHTELYAFGVQAELCRRTECAACFAVRWWNERPVLGAYYPAGAPPDWSLLVTHPARIGTHAHHEPHRSTTGQSLDRDTMPLCPAHHTDGNWLCVRHRLRSDATDARAFYSFLPFDWRAVVAEMRRRVAITKTASETP